MKRLIKGIKRLIADILEFIIGFCLVIGYIALCVYLSSVFCYYALDICISCPKTAESEDYAAVVGFIAAIIFFSPIGLIEIIDEYFFD